ncbi:MAG: hypothetical protein IPF41_13165 [Flavobacteriales bacterium]|nr:hypothetical protein [Flavobacteriales bacterium]
MSGMQDLWDDGKLAIVQGVSYPDPNFSHFRATDIYETGADANQLLSSGWTGRYLNFEYPNYPAGYPNTEMPDPLAIRVGGAVGSGLQYMGVSMGVAINNTTDPLNLAGNIYLDPAAAQWRWQVGLRAAGATPDRPVRRCDRSGRCERLQPEHPLPHGQCAGR